MDNTSFAVIAPEIFLLVMACVVALVDLGVKSKLRTVTYALTMVTLALVANQLAQPLPQARFILSQAAYAPGTRRVIIGHTAGLTSVAFSNDGKTAISAARDDTAILWDLTTGRPLRRLVVRHCRYRRCGSEWRRRWRDSPRAPSSLPR